MLWCDFSVGVHEVDVSAVVCRNDLEWPPLLRRRQAQDFCQESRRCFAVVGVHDGMVETNGQAYLAGSLRNADSASLVRTGSSVDMFGRRGVRFTPQSRHYSACNPGIFSAVHGAGNRRGFISRLLCTLTLAARLLPAVQHMVLNGTKPTRGIPVSVNFSQSGSSGSNLYPAACMQ